MLSSERLPALLSAGAALLGACAGGDSAVLPQAGAPRIVVPPSVSTVPVKRAGPSEAKVATCIPREECPDMKGWLFSGRWKDLEGSVHWDPAWRTARTSPTGSKGGLYLSLRDSEGLEVQRADVRAARPPHGPPPGAPISFVAVAKHDPKVSQAVLVTTETNKVISMIGRSAHAPEVCIKTPRPSTSVGESLVVSWHVSDEDAQPLTLKVHYQNGAGGMEVIATGIEAERGDRIEYEAEDLPGGNRSRVLVQVSDGFESDCALSPTFTVPGKAPHVRERIYNTTGPRDEYDPLDVIVLTADAHDTEDGPLAPDKLTWASDRDGPLGEGEVIIRANALSKGHHTITVTAVDSNGQVGTDTKRILLK